MKQMWRAIPPVISPDFLRADARLLTRVLKRCLDITLATILILILSPLMLVLAIWIKRDSPGPALYWQQRVGLGGRPFYMLKFRSMHTHAAEDLERILASDARKKKAWQRFQKLLDDPRLTRCGRVLRRFSLDELPQLWNVLRGEMSLVGPRPILPEQQGIYGTDLYLYLQVRPGMTGLWQVDGRNRVTFAERVARDVYYIRNQSIWTDFLILARTLRVVLRGDGA